MNYNEVKSCIDSCRGQISDLKRLIKKNNDEQENLHQSIQNIESSFQLGIRDEKEKALNTAIESATSEIVKSIANKNEVIAKKNQDFTAEMEDLQNVDITNSYTDEQAMTAEIRASLAILQTQLNKSISSRFQSELESQLDKQVLNIQPEDVDTIVKFFNKQSKSLSKMAESNIIDNVIDKILRNVRVPLPDDTSDNKGKITYGVLSVILVVIFCLSAKVIFPFYVFFLGLLVAYNISKNYKIYAALISQKAVKDNLEIIENTLKTKAERKLAERKEKVQEKYNKELLQLQKELEILEQQKIQAESEVNSSFSFDTAESHNRYQNALKINNSRMQQLKNTGDQLKNELVMRQNELQRFEDDLRSIAGDLQNDFLNYEKIGTDAIFNNKFLVDFKGTKPVYFLHPKGSALFLYDSVNDVTNFIRLLIVQLRTKINPNNLKCAVVDFDSLGVPFLAFSEDSENTENSVKNLFRIITTNDDVKELNTELNDSVSKRIMSIRKSYNNIEDYNRAMLETDSLTEIYNFVFYQNPTQNILNDDNFKKVYVNGGSLGIYSHVFLKKSEFYEMGDMARSLIENASGIYALQDGNINKRAKEFALERLVKSEE